MQKIRARLTFANVVACMALFVALGGVGYAATKLPKNSVGSKQLKNGAVSTAKLKAKAVTAAKLGARAVGAANLGTGAVGTAALANGAVTGAKVNTGSLGTVPSAIRADTAGDATTLQGRPPTAFIQGEGEIFGNTVQLAFGEKLVPVLSIPGFGPLSAECRVSQVPPVGGFKFVNTSGARLTTILQSNAQYPATISGEVTQPGEVSGVVSHQEIAAWTWTFSTLTSPARILTLNLGFQSNGTPTACALTAQAVISG
jgi:hypothetical protein